MPRRSKVKSLPKNVREALDEKLVEEGFQNYEDLADWLAEQGYDISKSSVHRYGQEFEDRLEALRIATAQAKEITEQVGDDEGALGDALTAVVQEKAFGLLTSMEMEEQEVEFTSLMNAIARLQKASVQQKKFMQEMREKAQQAAEEAEEIAREGGLSEDGAEKIRAKILGITE
jgi:DNA-binding ferritin-like protein (Dps family)